jgi:hypothetical protein
LPQGTTIGHQRYCRSSKFVKLKCLSWYACTFTCLVKYQDITIHCLLILYMEYVKTVIKFIVFFLYDYDLLLLTFSVWAGIYYGSKSWSQQWR